MTEFLKFICFSNILSLICFILYCDILYYDFLFFISTYY